MIGQRLRDPNARFHFWRVLSDQVFLYLALTHLISLCRATPSYTLFNKDVLDVLTSK
jgi:hypothetical protein